VHNVGLRGTKRDKRVLADPGRAGRPGRPYDNHRVPRSGGRLAAPFESGQAPAIFSHPEGCRVRLTRLPVVLRIVRPTVGPVGAVERSVGGGCATLGALRCPPASPPLSHAGSASHASALPVANGGHCDRPSAHLPLRTKGGPAHPAGTPSRPVEADALWEGWKTLRKKRSAFPIPSHRARKAPPATLRSAPPTTLGPFRSSHEARRRGAKKRQRRSTRRQRQDGQAR
jgi:hypothetical protein